MDQQPQQIAQLNEYRNGLFEVAMLLYKEYSKYMDPSDAKVCVFRDMQDKAKQFLDQPIEGTTTTDIAKNVIKSKIKDLEKRIETTKDTDLQMRLNEDVDMLEAALGILNT